MKIEDHERIDDEPTDDPITPDSDEPRDPISTVTIKYNLMTGDIDFEMEDGLNRMQIRSILSNALMLLDADIISQAFENKMSVMAKQAAEARLRNAIMARGGVM